MKTYIALLGDPAKIELYDDEFYSLLKHDRKGCGLHLIGASENGLGRKAYSAMYENFEKALNNTELSPIEGLVNSTTNHFSNRIGLFPSSTKHLIKGPKFVFAPFPLNSNSKYLKFKSRFLTFILRPFLSLQIRTLGYLPLGGKAADKTKANSELATEDLQRIFYNARLSNWLDWFYLEAGSGQNSVDPLTIQDVLESQVNAMFNFNWRSNEFKINNGRYLVPRAIYGGGIKSPQDLEAILIPDTEVQLIPEMIVVGNISESNISMTYDILEKMQEINELPISNLSNNKLST